MLAKTIILFLLAINLTVFGQNDFGLKVSGGISKITTNLNSSLTKRNNQFVLSGHGGIFYDLYIKKKSLLGAELLFYQIGGKESAETFVTDEFGNQTEELIINEVWRHISYIGVPVYYGFKVKKMTLNLGVQASFVLKSSGRAKTEIPYNGDIIIWDDELDKLNIDNYDFGLKAGVVFSLTNKFAIEGTYYNNILGNQFLKVQQITVGLRYVFLTTTKNEKE